MGGLIGEVVSGDVFPLPRESDDFDVDEPMALDDVRVARAIVLLAAAWQ